MQLGMFFIGGNFRQRQQYKGILGNFIARQFNAGLNTNKVAIGQNINIQRARTVFGAAPFPTIFIFNTFYLCLQLRYG